ncbi:MAG TPA: Gfo/Idh/MocA family oxidoreductase [Candidatus Polarisedimenticolia bacterium]|nr:Gfo/Idh/MocA family oxidoreductase [Candidatus Polarisedimenticolia bacterium]
MKRRSQRPSGPRRSARSRGPVRYAVVGLGYIAQAVVLPAFAHARNSRIAALVSEDPVKLRKLGDQYGVARRCAYPQFDALLRSGEIDAVFIALPNHLHSEYAILAARAGIHVLCEKPMATSATECRAMIDAARKAGVKLMIAYRLHFERGNLTAAALVRSGKLGDPRAFTADFTMQVADEENIRLKDALGGGTLYDIGIYCINAARALLRGEPLEVACWTARKKEKRFREVEETACALLRFPGERLASFTCSFGASDVSSYRVIGTRGDLRVEPAFEFAGEIVHHLTIDGRRRERRFPKRDQFAPELVHFSDCILRDRRPAPGGEEGLLDVQIIEALYESARIGRSVKLDLSLPHQRPRLSQEMRRPPVRKPALVNASSPSAGGD